MSAAIVLADSVGHITFANRGVERIFGFSAKYVSGTADYRHWPFMHLDGTPYGEHEMPLARAIEQRENVAGELMRFRRPDGREINLSSNAVAIKDANGEVTAALMVCTDVSEQRDAEQALLESEERYRLLVHALDEGVLWVDADGLVVASNPAAARILGLKPDQLNGSDPKRWAKRLVRADRSPLPIEELPVKLCLARGEPCNDVIVGALSDTVELQWLSFDCSPLFRDDEAKPYAAVCSFSDITQRKRTEETLRDAKAAAEAANHAKDQFLATISHELRTPLSAIGLWARVLSNKPDRGEQFQEAIEGILHGVQSQKKLIDDLIDSSRIAMGKLRLDLRKVDLGPVIAGAIGAMRAAAENKRIDLREQIDPNLGVVVADADRLEQVLWNLLSNAVKFTHDGGAIDVSIARRDGHVEFRVADTGQGITSEVLPHVFAPFRQGAATGAHRASGGLGLGLSIAKEIVELHGGTINVTSAGAGQGTTAVVRLPLARLGQRAVEKSSKRDDHASPIGRLNGIDVLLVEDDAANRYAVEALLRFEGASVIAVDSGAAALQEYQGKPPAIIVADINMPEMNGYELIQRIRAIESETGTARVPAIALTALTGEREQTRAIESGFDRHVSKPPDPAALFNTIAQLVRDAT